MKARIDFPEGDGTRLALRFAQPVCLLSARRLADVENVMTEAERLAKTGCWVLGFVSYEAAPAFDSALGVATTPSFLPLAFFAVYDRPVESPTEMFPQRGLGRTWQGSPWQMDVNYAQVGSGISTIRGAIAEGKYYQINYTDRLRSSGTCDGATFFESLRLTQPGGYCVHFEHADWQILSVSPELFFDWNANQTPASLTTKPMKGTAPRHASPDFDEAAALALRESTKDRAENLMIVDLLRNDMARVAATGTVSVPELFAIEGLPTAWQMTSTVQCVTRPEISLFDVFRALFPCGSVTGAPKVAAMTAIAALETSPRGAYCGAIGLIRPGGHATFNVGIRTVTLDTAMRKAECGLGSGITWESSARDEYAEWLVKRRFLLRASAGFDLYETLRLEGGAYVLLERHLFRMQLSAEYFGFVWDPACSHLALDQVRAIHSNGSWRVRLLLDCHGSFRTECTALASPATGDDLLVVLAKTAVESADERLQHKTTQRGIYDAHRLPAGCYDTLLWNERNELTEFTRGNVVVEMDGRLLTPPLHCGLLPGTLRAEMLSQGKLAEAIVRVEQLESVSRIWFINSVRGMLSVNLTTLEAIEGCEHVD